MSSNLVIVAIPEENDRVWKVSSEQVPHLTVLFLGDSDQVSDVDQIVQFVEHAANTSLRRFYLPVDRRGELGADQADVLFFKKNYDYKAIRDFRSLLLQDSNIKSAYDATSQFDTPEAVGKPGQLWVPHLTLGYPTSPSKPLPEDQDYRFYDVCFHKIAVWVGDYDGPEFLLKDQWDEMEVMDTIPMDVAMSDIRSPNETREELGLATLEHYGVKGMRWGVRKTEVKTSRWDPEGHDIESDIVKAVVWPMVPPLGIFAIPAEVRLIRGAARVANAKLVNLEEKKFAANAQSQKNFVEIHNRASDRINREIPEVNKRHPDDLTTDPAKQKAYDNDIQKLLQDSYREAANSVGNKNRTMHLDLEFRNDGMDFAIKAKDGRPKPIKQRVKHADEDEPLEFEVDLEFSGKVERDATGHILGLRFTGLQEDSMAQTAELGAAFLAHYGVKGMRWGQRKSEFVTRKHQQALAKETARREKRPAQDVRAVDTIGKRKRKQAEVKTKGGEDHPPTEDAIKIAVAKQKLKKSGPAALTNVELAEMQRRLNLENEVLRLTAGQKTRGQRFVDGLLGRGSKDERRAVESQAGQAAQEILKKKARAARAARTAARAAAVAV